MVELIQYSKRVVRSATHLRVEVFSSVISLFLYFLFSVYTQPETDAYASLLHVSVNTTFFANLVWLAFKINGVRYYRLRFERPHRPPLTISMVLMMKRLLFVIVHILNTVLEIGLQNGLTQFLRN